MIIKLIPIPGALAAHGAVIQEQHGYLEAGSVSGAVRWHQARANSPRGAATISEPPSAPGTTQSHQGTPRFLTAERTCEGPKDLRGTEVPWPTPALLPAAASVLTPGSPWPICACRALQRKRRFPSTQARKSRRRVRRCSPMLGHSPPGTRGHHRCEPAGKGPGCRMGPCRALTLQEATDEGCSSFQGLLQDRLPLLSPVAAREHGQRERYARGGTKAAFKAQRRLFGSLQAGVFPELPGSKVSNPCCWQPR